MTERELLAQGIRRAILASGKTEAQVAARLNLGASAVYKWTRGESRPNASNLRRFCALLDVDESAVWEGHPGFTDDTA